MTLAGAKWVQLNTAHHKNSLHSMSSHFLTESDDDHERVLTLVVEMNLLSLLSFGGAWLHVFPTLFQASLAKHLQKTMGSDCVADAFVAVMKNALDCMH